MAKTTSIARRFAMLVILAAVSLLGYEYWANEVVWPEFSTNQASAQAPQAVLKIERDYGWRTGDVLPVELYIKETPGTRVDLAAITMQNQAGDFEVRDALSPVRTKSDDSGAHLIKAKFSVQSLNYGETRSLSLTLPYRVLATAETNTIQAPALVVHMSKTYDGRLDIQPLRTEMLSPVWDYWQNALLFLLAAAMIFADVYLKSLHALLNRPAVTVTDQVRSTFDDVWRRLESGDCSKENYEELERLVRRLFNLEPQTRGQIELQVSTVHHRFEYEIITIISLCDKRLYDHKDLTAEEHGLIRDAFQRIFTDRPLRRYPQVSTTVGAQSNSAAAPTGGEADAAEVNALSRDAAQPERSTQSSVSGGDEPQALPPSDGPSDHNSHNDE